MITDSALNLALVTVSLPRSSYDRMNYMELQKYLQNYKYKNNNNNFEYARNILLEAKSYNPYSLMFAPMSSMMKIMDSVFNASTSPFNVSTSSSFNASTSSSFNASTSLNGTKYVYKREVKSNNGNGYIKEEKYSYNGKDKPTITSTYGTITNGKIDSNKTITN
jgi:hypothetical protein